MSWKYYKKIEVQKLRPYVEGEDMTNISVSPNDVIEKNGMIKVDKEGNLYYVPYEDFLNNYVPTFILNDDDEDRDKDEVVTYRGEFISNMSREELVKALSFAVAEIKRIYTTPIKIF